MADAAVAYPPPGYRIRKLERILYGQIGRAPVQRVNREVFRRAVGPVPDDRLTTTALGTLGPSDDPSARSGWALSRRTTVFLSILAHGLSANPLAKAYAARAAAER